MESICPYLPWMRLFRLQENNGAHLGRSGTTAGILTRQTTTAVQTTQFWMWHVTTQMVETCVPVTVHLVGERYWPMDLGCGLMDWKCLYLPLVPGINLSVLLPVGAASFQGPHCDNAPLSFATWSKLILSASFNYWLDCALKQAGCSS